MKFIFNLLSSMLLAFCSYAQQKPNIVFMLADDCTSWDIGVYGNKDSKTPTIDRLAAEGMMFTKCYQSAPMCSPTRQNILTGLYPVRSGAYPNHTSVKENVKSIEHYLKTLGYKVALSGKKHYGPAENFPLEYLGKAEGKDSDPNFYNIDSFLGETSSQEQPFCLFISSNQPHTPWNKGDTTLFDKTKLKLPPFYPDLPKTRSAYRDYLAEINYLDGQVQTALNLLEKHKLENNTIFIFASEQGNALPFAKWTCYNAGLKSALIVKWPGMVKPGSVSDALVDYSDIVPTMIDLAGGKPISELDGKSIVPVLTQEKKKHNKYTYGQMTTRGIINGSDYYPIRSISNGRYRYISNLASEVPFKNWVFSQPFFTEWEEDAKSNPQTKKLVQKYRFRPAEELYDDDKDPYNQHNLASDPIYKKIKKELKGQLQKWMSQVGDEGIITELLAIEHMPAVKSGFPVAIDTSLHEPKIIKSARHIEVPVDGYYTFYISGEGKLEVDNQEVVPFNTRATKTSKRYGVIGLKKGVHSIFIGNSLPGSVSWSGPETILTNLE
ncbi:sulfatase family protein [Arenibacter echinorum]|uniref:Putative sulfatase n=1 Tax=Arenibacter echinorum TaxID=440515 RepID=A0A327R0U3_9FLAO|nr:sulfatase [Arenibacter echinorum]RAJ10241.1 putative sulfatase [Arenibacter echinorum]